jgi:hypothetical protein
MKPSIKYFFRHKVKISNSSILFFFLYLSLLFGFFLNENSSGGSKKDFHSTLFLVYSFSEDFNTGIRILTGSSLPHPFLHYFILGIIYKYIQNIEILRFFFLHFSVLIPILIYKTLKLSLKKNHALFLSSLIFLSPYFRSSAIWGTTDNTALLFFTFSIYFFFKLKKNINNYQYSILFLFFLSLASLTRSYYIIFIILFIYSLRKKKLSIKFIILNLIFFSIMLIPNIWHYSIMKKTIHDFLTKNIINNLYINLSIIFFYLLPFIANSKENIIKFYTFIKKNINKLSIISIIFFVLFKNFDYFEYNHGGGILFQITKFYFYQFLFIVISLMGFVTIYYFIKNKRENCLLIFIFFISFNYIYIYQKYFDPLFLITLLTLSMSFISESIIKNNFIKKFFFIFVYFGFFLIISIIKSSEIATN